MSIITNLLAFFAQFKDGINNYLVAIIYYVLFLLK